MSTELKNVEYVISVKEHMKLYRLIRIFGSNNLDAVNFLDANKNVYAHYLALHHYDENNTGDNRCVDYIKGFTKRNPHVKYVQLIKK